ncbi:hypothetical protein AP3564_13095 [Aeribacillus pallidus]|uniref:Uncharacterized protein n=1 Tax=Aeribacillus pallidus TaxID=33936 RepID=A0A223E6Z9_9BACI|nr:hypothetical protein AP3564_13095 [Aeribacillus pallidus]
MLLIHSHHLIEIHFSLYDYSQIVCLDDRNKVVFSSFLCPSSIYLSGDFWKFFKNGLKYSEFSFIIKLYFVHPEITQRKKKLGG